MGLAKPNPPAWLRACTCSLKQGQGSPNVLLSLRHLQVYALGLQNNTLATVKST